MAKCKALTKSAVKGVKELCFIRSITLMTLEQTGAGKIQI